MTTRTFVLVPGAWMGGWVWAPVAAGLEELGHRVHALTLSGMTGDTDTDRIGLHTHVDDVRRFLERARTPGVTLVGHSYSGLVVGQVADQVPDLVEHVVYVDAFVPEDGASLLDAFPADQRDDERRQIAQHGGRWPAPDVAGAADGHGLDTEQARWLVQRMVDQPGRTVTEPAALRHPLGAQPATYIQCSFDDTGKLAALRRSGQWTFHTLKTGHWPMLSSPAALVTLLDSSGHAPPP